MQAAHMQLIKFNQSATIIPSVLRAHISGMHIKIQGGRVVYQGQDAEDIQT